MTNPTRLTLRVFSEFKASHSLEGFETPHFHVWKLTLEFKGSLPLNSDRLIDMIHVQEQIAKITAPIEGRYLNATVGFSPTSENMAIYVWNEFQKQNPDVPLSAVGVTLCSLSGDATGSARIES